MSSYDNNHKTPIEKRNSIISALSTLVFMALLVALCAFMGMKYPDPPIPEEGVEVNLGNSDFGLGDAENPDASENINETATPSSQSQEEISTQSAPSVALNTSKQPTTTPKKIQTEQPSNNRNTEPATTNTRAQFPGKKSNAGSQGVTYGGGNQGKAGGSPTSNRYDGKPGNGGTSFNLKGRANYSIPEPRYNSKDEGTIIIQIYVDRNGNVQRAEVRIKGTTIHNKELVNQAKEAAMKAKFNADPNATELQIGTITYRLQNVGK